MTLYATKTSILGIKEESTDGTLLAPAATGDFTVLRDGFSLQGGIETVDSDELIDSLAAGSSFFTKEAPTASIPHYLKHSGTEGTAPDYGVMIKSALGNSSAAGTEYDTVSGSTAGSATVRPVINVNTGEGANFSVGQALLIKDAVNGYAIRNIYSKSSDALSCNYNLAGAAAVGVNTGKAVQYYPANAGHPTYSLWHYQQQSSSANAFSQAIAGCRTTAINLNFASSGLAEINFEVAGSKYYMNPIEITNSNKYIDITDDGGTIAVTLATGWYKSPKELAREITTKATAASVGSGNDTITCTFSSTTGKFTLTSNGSTFSLLWLSGTNTASSVGTTLGFVVSANDTGATTYTSDNAITFGTSYAPNYNAIDPFVCKHQELYIGDWTRRDVRKTSNVSFSIATPRTEAADITAESGIAESMIMSRTTTFSATLYLQKHELDEFDAMINNTTTQVMFNAGVKNGGYWVAGKCFNIWMPQVNITQNLISNSNGIFVFEVTGRGKASTTFEDVYLNFL